MKNLIIIFLGFTFLYSCIKNNDPLTENTPGVKVIDKTITNAMYFKPGSYWIFESDKGEIDSMWSDAKSSIAFNGNDKTQLISTYLFSSIQNNSIVLDVEHWNPNLADTQYRIKISSWYGSTSGGGGNLSNIISADIFRPAKGTNNICVTCKGDTAILMPSYTLNGKVYKNVWRFLSRALIQNFPNSLTDNNIGEYYFAENVGLIEKEGVYYKLIRYHIEK